MEGRIYCMANKTNKKLTSSNILSLHSKTFSQKKVLLESEGQTFEVLIDTKFQPSKIQALIMELAEQQQKIKHLDDILDISYFVSFLVVKHFTDISITKTVGNNFEQQIRVLKAMVDLGIFEQIMDGFDKQELDKINIYIKKASDNIKEMDKNPEAKKGFEDIIKDLASLENPEVFLGDRDEIKEEENVIE